MKLYSSDMLDEYKIRRKNGYKFSFYPLIIILPLFIFFILIAKLKTRVLFIALSTIDLSIFAVIFIYNLLENIIKSKDLMIHINSILSSKTTEFSGVITDISDVITLKRNIHIVEVEINNNGVINKPYFNIDLFNVDFKEGDNINIKISNNFITEYEVS